MLPKKKQKVDSEECNKICIIHFPSSNVQRFVNLFQTADKDKKFEKIKQNAFKRLNQPGGSSYKLSQQCANIPTTLMNHHGYHRNCYQRFTKYLDRRKEVEKTFSSGMNIRFLTVANKWNDGVLFNKDCIFCNKMVRIKVRVRGVWNCEFGGGGTIQEIAIKNKNFQLLTIIEDVDYVRGCCKEAMYHASCRKSFIRNLQLGEVLFL